MCTLLKNGETVGKKISNFIIFLQDFRDVNDGTLTSTDVSDLNKASIYPTLSSVEVFFSVLMSV